MSEDGDPIPRPGSSAPRLRIPVAAAGRWRGRPPVAAPRRRPRPRLRSGPRPGRGATLWIPLPAPLLDRIERDVGLAASGGSGPSSWGPLERDLHRHVYGRLPAAASDVRLALEDRRGRPVVVARFRLGGGPGACAGGPVR